jgi:hypothetical protein
MGLLDIKGKILGTNSDYHIDPMQLNNADYLTQLAQSQQAYNTLNDPGNQSALGALGRNDVAGANQAALVQQLMAQANGQGPSLAQMQLQQASDQNIKNAAGAIAGVKGINPAQAARQVALAQQSQGQNLANNSAQLRLNEQLQKQQMAGNLLQQQRAQDVGQYQGQLNSNQQMYSTAGQLNNQQTQNQIQNYMGAAGINSGISQSNAANNQKDLEGDKKFMSGMLGGMAAHGGVISGGHVIPAYADGGVVSFVPQQIAPLQAMDMIRRPVVTVPDWQSDSGGYGTGIPGSKLTPLERQQTDALDNFNPNNNPGASAGSLDLNGIAGMAAHGAVADDNVKVAVSPGEKIVSPEGDIKKVPGVSNHPGDDPRNDKVVADLREGSIVVPRTKAEDKEKMIDFIRHMKSMEQPKDPIAELLESHGKLNSKLESISKQLANWRKG